MEAMHWCIVLVLGVIGAFAVFDEMGISPSAAMQLFLQQVLMVQAMH